MKGLTNDNKKLIVVLFMTLILITATTIASADDLFSNPGVVTPDNNTGYEELPDEGNNTNTNIENIYGDTDTNNTNNTYNDTNNNTNNNTNTNSNSSSLPQTGIQDYTIGIMIIICIASAIYAYKKVKDYKDI